MKILVLGGKGMAGHVITAYFQQKSEYNVFYTTRNEEDKDGIFIDVTNLVRLEKIIDSIKPDIIINCIGILNEHASQNTKLAFYLNSLLPHQLVKLTERYQGKIIHISTDCVFLGTKGDYTETDITDGTSIYSHSKQLGEIVSNKHLTIRTSFIGPELKDNGIGLFLWCMKQKGQIKGYQKVLWNGVTSLELAKAMGEMISNNITGIYHLGSNNKISKYELLKLIQEIFEKDDVEILPDNEVVLDRTIKSAREDFCYNIPTYEDMLLELKVWMQNFKNLKNK